MKERPILFNGRMVRAILDGVKTVTRRPIKPEPLMVTEHGTARWAGAPEDLQRLLEQNGRKCPYGEPGDRLWVREAWARTLVAQAPGEEWVVYRDGDNRTDYGGPWKPSIHMRRCDSRILLEITAVRVEPLQHITIGQICREGLARSIYEFIPVTTAFDVFADLWNSTGGDWDANPWVWVVEFKRVTP